MSDSMIGVRDRGWRKINHRHEDGRNCIEGPDGVWRHWDYEGRVLAPGEPTPELECGRVHPSREEREWHPVEGSEGRDVEAAVVAPDDRGEFGMPTIGGELRIGPVIIGPGKMMWWMEEGKSMTQFKMTVTENGILIDYGENGENVDAATDDARYILANVLPRLLSEFLKNNAKYARAQDRDLGLKGIVPDVNRKASVIIDRLWYESPTVGEGTDKVIDDLIGHLLLMRAKMRAEP